MRPLNILYIHPSNELYGADRSLFRLVRDLDRERFHPVIAISNDIQYSRCLLSLEFQKIQVETHLIAMAVLRRAYFNLRGLVYLTTLLASSVWKLARLIHQQKIDIVHSNSSVVLSGALAAFVMRRPHLWHVREIYTSPRFLGKLVAKLISHFSHVVVAVSEAVKNKLVADGCNPSKIIVVHNGIDVERYASDLLARSRIRAKLGVAKDTLVVGMLGRISSWKGQEVLVQAAHTVVQKHPHTYFVLAGGVVEWESFRRAELEALIDQLGLGSHVLLEDFRTDVGELLAAFDIFVLPSTRPDPYPTVVLEAMAAGLPVIAFAHGGVIEMVDNTCGLLVPQTEPQSLATAICQLLNDPAKRIKMGQMARILAHTRFTTAHYVSEMSRLYQQICQITRG